MSDLSSFLSSINSSKKNLFDESESKEALSKMYPRWQINRLLSYDINSVLYLNELNIKSLEAHNTSNRMAYEFLLYVLPKGKRFARLERPIKSDDVSYIMESCKYSSAKANDVLEILETNQEYMKLLKESQEFGGINGKLPKKKG